MTKESYILPTGGIVVMENSKIIDGKITTTDVGASLAAMPRYNGAASYSVAAHSFHMAQYAERNDIALAYACLMHDIDEMITGDINRIFKESLGETIASAINRKSESIRCEVERAVLHTQGLAAPEINNAERKRINDALIDIDNRIVRNEIECLFGEDTWEAIIAIRPELQRAPLDYDLPARHDYAFRADPRKPCTPQWRIKFRQIADEYLLKG